MWYFSWILGLGFASLFGLVSALWFEAQQTKLALSAAIKDEEAVASTDPLFEKIIP